MTDTATLEQVKAEAETFVRAQGFTPFVEQDEYDPAVWVVRMKRGDTVLSSVTLPKSLVGLPIDEVQTRLSALVLDACRAAVKEPALRAEGR